VREDGGHPSRTPDAHVRAAERGAGDHEGCEVAGHVGVGFHTLRHGFASTLILGSPIRCACSGNSGTLGPSLTLDVYAHIFERAGDLRERIGASSLAAAVARS
jgi:integrase